MEKKERERLNLIQSFVVNMIIAEKSQVVCCCVLSLAGLAMLENIVMFKKTLLSFTED